MAALLEDVPLLVLVLPPTDVLDHFDLLRTLLKKNDFDAWARNIGPRKLDEPLDTEVFEFRSQLLQGEVLKLHLVLLGPSTRPSVGWLQKVTGYTGSLELINGLGHDRTMTDLYENQCYMEHDVADYEPEIVPLAASPDDQEDLLSGRKNADEVDLLGVVLTCRLYLGIPLCMLGKPVALTFAVTQRQGVQATICPSLRTFDVTTAVDGLSEPCPTSWAAPPLAALCNTARSSAVAGCARRAPYPVVSLEELLSSVAGASKPRKPVVVCSLSSSMLLVETPFNVNVAHTRFGVYCEVENASIFTITVLSFHLGQHTRYVDWVMDVSDVRCLLVPNHDVRAEQFVIQAAGVWANGEDLRVEVVWLPTNADQLPVRSRLASVAPSVNNDPLEVTFSKVRVDHCGEMGLPQIVGLLSIKNETSKNVDVGPRSLYSSHPSQLHLNISRSVSCESDEDECPLLLPLSLSENVGVIAPQASRSILMTFVALSSDLLRLPPLQLVNRLDDVTYTVRGIKCHA